MKKAAFFIVIFFGICDCVFSQSLDTLFTIQVDKKAVLDSLLRLDSIRTRRREFQDSAMLISNKIRVRVSENKLTQGLEEAGLLSPSLSRFEVPQLHLPDPKLDQLRIKDAIPESMRSYGEDLKSGGAKLKGLKGQVGGIVDQAGVIRSKLDTVSQLPSKDSIMTGMLEQGAERLEAEFGGQEEFSPLSQSSDVKGIFSERMTAEMTEGKADLPKLQVDTKQIQQDYFPDAEKITEAKQSLDGYKGKYKELKDSRIGTVGIKRQSLNGKSFVDRSEFSLMGNFASFNPFVFQTSVGYRLDKQWTAGVGVIGSAGGQVRSMNWSGISVFGQFWPKEALFVQTEYQNRPKGSFEEGAKKNQSFFMVGLGTEVGLIWNLRIRSTVLYRINKPEDISAGLTTPWQAVIGLVRSKK